MHISFEIHSSAPYRALLFYPDSEDEFDSVVFEFMSLCPPLT